jgi:Histidine kinase-, DNA gyrase B-, and HSP90-like ATPase
MTKEIDITPKTHILTSMARQDMAPSLAIVELIDNSLDAHGQRNSVDYDVISHVITISDDGVGAPDPSAIVTMGEHDSEGRDTSGRYGIGAKDAIMALGTAVEVVTVRNGLRRTVRADFEEMLSTGRWVAREDQESVETGTSTGTVVRIRNVKRKIYPSDIARKLAATFAPALRRGKLILVNGIAVDPPAEVEVTHRLEGGGLFGVKQYRWWAGIKCDGQKVDGGWRFEFKNRVLDSTSSNRSYGTQDMDTHKFYGVITLIEPEDAEHDERWSVNKHKTSAEELEDLCEAIFPQVKELVVQAAEEHAITLESEIADDVGRELTEALSESRMRKERRNTNAEEHQHGTVLPRNTGKRRRRARSTQDGDGGITTVDDFSGKRFSIIMVDDDVRFGWVEGNRKSNKVYLGRLHEYWQLKARNRDLVKMAAMSLLTGHAITTEDSNQPIMAAVVQSDCADKKFQLTLGNMASQVASREEASV